MGGESEMREEGSQEQEETKEGGRRWGCLGCAGELRSGRVCMRCGKQRPRWEVEKSGDDYALHANDGERRVIQGGRLLGPDGAPLESILGLSDRRLEEKKEEQVAVTAAAGAPLAAPLGQEAPGPRVVHVKVALNSTEAESFPAGNTEVPGLTHTLLFDSGAGETMLTWAVYQQLVGHGLPQTHQIVVEDINGKRVKAVGGGPVYGYVDACGIRQRVLVASRVFSAEGFSMCLLSAGDVRLNGGDMRIDGDGVAIQWRKGVETQLDTDDEKTWWLNVTFEPYYEGAESAGEVTRQKHDTGRKGNVRYGNVAFDTIHACPARLNPNGKLARQPPVELLSVTSTRDAVEPELTNDEAQEEDGEADESDFMYHHCAFNHQNPSVDYYRERKLISSKMPENFRCYHCLTANAEFAAHKHGSKAQILAALCPFAEVAADVCGPFDVGDRNGFRYIVGFICAATGTAFVQPVRQKSQAVDVLKAFVAWVGSVARFIEAKCGYPPGHVKVHTLRTDRGGEFTTTWGATRSEFDDTCNQLIGNRLFTSVGEPLTGTAKIERFWGTMKDAGNASMEASKLPRQFLFDAYTQAAYTYNRMPTLSNLMGNGEPPFATLGVPSDLSRIVPFGNRCVVKRSEEEGGNAQGRIIGIVVDGPGYRAWLENTNEVVASVNIIPRRNGKAWEEREDGTYGPVVESRASPVGLSRTRLLQCQSTTMLSRLMCCRLCKR